MHLACNVVSAAPAPWTAPLDVVPSMHLRVLVALRKALWSPFTSFSMDGPRSVRIDGALLDLAMFVSGFSRWSGPVHRAENPRASARRLCRAGEVRREIDVSLPITDSSVLPLPARGQGLQRDVNIEATAGLQYLLSTLQERCCHHRMQDSLPAGWPLP